MSAPTDAEIDQWNEAACKAADEASPVSAASAYTYEFATLAYQAGLEAALEELRGGGVELPEPLYTSSHRSYGESYSHAQLLDYGDRRAAAERERIADVIKELISDGLQDPAVLAEKIRGAKK